MSFLNNVVLPNSSGNSKSNSASTGSFLSNVVLPKDQNQADKIAQLQQEASQATRDATRANSSKGIFKATIADLGHKVVNVPIDFVHSLWTTYQQTPEKLAQDVQAGAQDFTTAATKGGIAGTPAALKGFAKAGGRTAGDAAIAIFAPISSAIGALLNASGGQKLTDATGQVIADKSGITNLPAFQQFALNHPNAGEDFNRILTLFLSKGEKGQIDPLRINKESQNFASNLLDQAKKETPATKVPVKTTTPEAQPVKISTPTTRHAEYAKSQGYEPITSPEQLPSIQMGSKPKSTLPTIQIGENPRTGKVVSGDYTYEPIKQPVVKGGFLDNVVAPKEAAKTVAPKNFSKAEFQFQPNGDTSNYIQTYDNYIKSGDIPAAEVYKDVTGKIYQPKVAQQILDDAQRALIEENVPNAEELGKQLASKVDVNNMTPDSILKAGQEIIKEAQGKITTSSPQGTQLLETSKIDLSQYYPSLKKSLPLSDAEFATISKENPGLVEMVRNGTAEPIPVRLAADGNYEPNADGATRLIIAKHLGIDKIPVIFENGQAPVVDTTVPKSGTLETNRAPSVLQITDVKTGESTMQAVRPEDFNKVKDLIDTGNKNKAQALQDATGKSYHLTATPETRMINAGIKPISGYFDPESVTRITEGTRPLKPIGEGDIRTSRLAANVEANAIEKKLSTGFGDLPQYRQMNLANQAQKAIEFLNTDPEHALNVALGKELPPNGLIPETIFTAVEDRALKAGDTETLLKLGTESSLSTEATAMGQRIRALGERSQDSPVRMIQEVQKARETAVEKSLGKKVKEAKQATVDEIKTQIKKNLPKKQNWSDFIESIQCGY